MPTRKSKSGSELFIVDNSDEGIRHYHRIVITLNETIRLMGEIDEVIEAHGGWPGAFITDPDALAELRGRPKGQTKGRR